MNKTVGSYFELLVEQLIKPYSRNEIIIIFYLEKLEIISMERTLHDRFSRQFMI